MHDPGSIPQQFDPPTPRKKAPWPWIGLGCGLLSVLTVVAVVAGLVLVVNDDDRGGTFAVNESFEVRNVRYMVCGVHSGVPTLGDAFDNARPVRYDAFVLVILRVTNERPFELSVDTSDFVLHSGGTAYTPSDEAGAAALIDDDFGFGSDTEYGTVNAREVRDMPLVYDAPDTDLTHMTITPGSDPGLQVTVDLTP